MRQQVRRYWYWLTRHRPIILIAVGVFGAVVLFLMVRSNDIDRQQLGTPQDIDGEFVILPRQLQNLPGTKVDGDSVRILGADFALIDQDGLVARPNAPVNLAGPHFTIDGDFTVAATLQEIGDSAASVQLYGRPPVIADEFRIERGSARITVSGDKLTVRVWDDGETTPATTNVFAFTPQPSNKLTITRQGGLLRISMNSHELGAVPERRIFAFNQLWFGADSVGGDWSLARLSVTELPGAKLSMVEPLAAALKDLPKDGLQYRAAQKRADFIVGFAGALGPIVSDPAYAGQMLNKYNFGGMTTENALKMQFTQPQEGMYTLQEADALVRIAKQHGLSIHGHALVFGEANPRWFNDLPAQSDADKNHIEAIMNDRIKTLVGHYKNDIESWDVVNEPLADYDHFDASHTLRDHTWHKAMGEAYIAKALIAAHGANTGAKLFINDYGLEENGERWEGFIKMLERLKPALQAAHVPLDKIGVGFQAHVYERGDKIDKNVLRSHIKQLAALGFMSQVSEMDVYSSDGDGVQAQQYADILEVCLQEPGCKAWRVWIAADKYNFWKDDAHQVQQGRDGLYDTAVSPRPVYALLMQLLR